MENFLECFTPIFEASEKYQTLKYRFLLFLSKAQNSKIYSMDNYRTFCNLIKGKLIYEEDTYKRLSKNMIENFKEKYPKEFTDNFKYFQIATIVEFLVEKEYKEQWLLNIIIIFNLFYSWINISSNFTGLLI